MIFGYFCGKFEKTIMVTYNYSTKKLATLLIIRLLPWLLFLFLALKFGEVFWVGAVAVLVEALVEVGWKAKIAYVKIDSTRVKLMGIFKSTEIKWDEVRTTYVYNNEWTFRTLDTEVRINANWVNPSQRETLKAELNEIRAQILEAQQENKSLPA